VKSWGDELARQVDLRIHPSVPDLPGLEAIPPDDRPNGIVCTVEADQSQWQFLIARSDAASPAVRVPEDNPAHGRWCLVGASQAASAGGPAALAAVKVAAAIGVGQFATLGPGVKTLSVPLGKVLPPGARPFARELKLATPFSGGGATIATLNLGGTVPNDIVAGQTVYPGAPAAMAGASGVNPTGDHGGQQLAITLSSDADLNKLTAGSITVSLFYAVLP
jgi:hypothetical protein